jgi:hypothetical protein
MNLRGVINLEVTLVEDENGDLLADSHNILNRRRTASLLLNVHKVNDVSQIEIRRAVST